MLSVGKWMALDIGLWEIRNRERGLLELQTTFLLIVLNIEEVLVARPQIG